MPARTGQIGKTVAEPIKFWWMILSLGQENHYSMYLTQSNTHDYEHLYQLDFLCLEDTSDSDQYTNYIENKEQQIYSNVHKAGTKQSCCGN